LNGQFWKPKAFAQIAQKGQLYELDQR
jgi:hypothetical protein